MSEFILSAFADEAGALLSEQIDALHEAGIACVELRGVDGKNVKDLTLDEAKNVRARLDAAGIRVSSMGSPFGKIGVTDDFEPHFREFEHALELCGVLGCDRMRMFSFYYPKGEDPAQFRGEVLSRLERMLDAADKAGITLCHENEKGIYGDIASRCLDLITHFGGRLKCIFDPANFIQCGEKPIDNYAVLRDHIYYMHIKDAYLKNGAVVPGGCGDANLPEILSDLGKRAQNMLLTVEPHLTVFKGLDKLQGEEVKHAFTYPDSRAAFSAACDALKGILVSQGYKTDKTGEWTKMNDVVRLGIIGVGNMGSSHAKSVYAGKVPHMVLGAVADVKPERREWAQQNVPGTPVFDDATKMMDSGLVDAIIVCTPHYDHPRLVREALSKGLHAMSEKPAGVYTKAVRELNEYALSQDKVYAIMFNQRTNCVYRKMREIVQSGELGNIRRVNWIITNWFRSQSYYDSGAWRATWDGEGGGVLLNQCPHNLDLWQWICGMPVKVRAFCHNGKWHDIEVEDDVTAYVEYPNGATGVFVTTTSDAPGTNRLEIDLDGGQLVCDGNKLIMRKLSVSIPEFHKTYKGGFGSPKVTESEVETDGENPQHNGVLKAYAEKILGIGELVAPGIEGINGLTLSNAMHLSSWLDKTIELPIDEDKFLEELNKRRAASKAKTVAEKTFDTSNTYSGTK
ncbi:MAG: TIM barrel protein [Clostridia bacterium]|nr:TIM barrel protein [Clostridia bacterium]